MLKSLTVSISNIISLYSPTTIQTLYLTKRLTDFHVIYDEQLREMRPIVDDLRHGIRMVKENDSHNKMKGLTSFIVVLFLLSIVISSQNSHLVNIVYADDNHDGIKNESLINDISDKIVNPSNNKDALQQILQLIQSQIAQTSGPDKATKVLNLIDSIVKLNPRGQLSQSLQYLAKAANIGWKHTICSAGCVTDNPVCI